MQIVQLQIFIIKKCLKKSQYKCLPIIILDSVIKANKKYYLQTFSEECKYVQEKIKIENYVNDDLKSDSTLMKKQSLILILVMNEFKEIFKYVLLTSIPSEISIQLYSSIFISCLQLAFFIRLIHTKNHLKIITDKVYHLFQKQIWQLQLYCGILMICLMVGYHQN